MIISLLLSLMMYSEAKTFEVAVLDTGIDFAYLNEVNICWKKSRDFTNTGFEAKDGHGSNIVNIIAHQLKGLDYCIIFIKIFDPKAKNAVLAYHQGLMYVAEIKPDIVNMSFGGYNPQPVEQSMIDAIIEEAIPIVAAAGNEGRNLDRKCEYYPACYNKKIVKVGNMYKSGKKYEGSNYGKVIDKWQVGVNVRSGGQILTGTSQATAIETGLEAKEMILKNKH